METIEEKLKRLIWDNQANGEEFFHLYGEMERAGEARMRLFSLLRESIYAGNEEAKAFFMKQIRQHGFLACGEVDTLCAAAYMDDVAMIRTLVEMGCELNTHGRYYNAFPLAKAASACRLAAVKELLRMGAEATMHHSYALFAACQAPEQESTPVEKVAPVVKELLDAGASPNPVIHSTSWSALLEALSNEDEDTAVLLIQHGGRVPESESITWWAEDMLKVMAALDEFNKRETK